MNFDKSSYEVREDSDVVMMIMIVLNQPSSKLFDVMIRVIAGTAKSKNLHLFIDFKMYIIKGKWITAVKKLLLSLCQLI